MKKLLILPIRFYRRFISRYTQPRCIFFPTCSAYAIEAIETHGALKGLLLTAWRLLRCNPFNWHGGYDPVPPKRKIKSEDTKN